MTMHDYEKMEKIGKLPFKLPEHNRQITTSAGDLILYQGDTFSIYYDSNQWSLTKLGKITHISANELKKLLGENVVRIKLSKKGV